MIPRRNTNNQLNLATRRAALLAGCALMALTGCRQPVTQPNSAGSPFSSGGVASLFQRNPQLAANSGVGANPAFQGSSPIATGVGTNNSTELNQLANQYQNLNQRLSAYDTDNQLLNTELAALKQKLELANQYGLQLKQQLADTSTRIQESESARQQAADLVAQAARSAAEVPTCSLRVNWMVLLASWARRNPAQIRSLMTFSAARELCHEPGPIDQRRRICA